MKPEFGPGISERVEEAINTSDENIDLCRSVKSELITALSSLLGVQTSSYVHLKLETMSSLVFGLAYVWYMD